MTFLAEKINLCDVAEVRLFLLCVCVFFFCHIFLSFVSLLKESERAGLPKKKPCRRHRDDGAGADFSPEAL